jgi:exonuclease SbcC
MMIPLKLELHNFLAYRDPEPLDLTGLHLACLVGANGAGKSSLLDAMTWVLWGKARSRRDDELIHGDEGEMQVRLYFLLDGNCYRVTRYRSRGDQTGRGNSALALEIQDGDDWRAISEATIRATQDKITRMLRLDYDTFINSAFLAQGRADEFTRKTPGERKTILGEILGLDVWTAYEERARRRVRTINEDRGQIDSQIDGIDEELAREVEYRADLDRIRQELDELVQQVRQVEAHYSELEDARRKRDDLRSRYDDLQGRVGRGEEELDRIRQDREKQLERVVALRDVLHTREEIESGYAALQDARRRERAFGDRLIQQGTLSERRSELQQAVTAARSELQAEQRALSQRRADLERKLSESAGEEPSREANAKIEALEARETECNEWREQLAEWREERAELEGINSGLKTEMDTLAMQRDQIEAAVEAECPLCGQELSDAHRAELLDTFAQRGNEKAETWRANRERIDELTREIAHLTKEVERAESELRNLPPLRQHVARQEERVRALRDAQAELDGIDTRLEHLEAVLAAEDYAHEEQVALSEVQEHLAALGYDEAEHQATREVITELEGFEAQKGDLDRALDLIPELEAAIAALGQQATGREEQLVADKAVLHGWADDIGALDEQLVDIERWEQELNDLRDREGQTRYRVGIAEQKVNALEQQRIRRDELVKRRDDLGEEQSIYEDLRQAFGKDGIPAMIIEAAIPDLEKEANQILTQMSDGQMYLQFDTQREKVTGGTKETLDIRIADGLGARDYATFSGGEAFRVNFSVRLALSRLLARRAGAQLRTLIIDEGFGTQDAQGRERLVQAINAIQDDFDLVLVITHIEELKDAFPARIEVTKTPDGSLIELV